MSVTLSTTSGSIEVTTASEVLFSLTAPTEVNATTERTIINVEVANSVNALR